MPSELLSIECKSEDDTAALAKLLAQQACIHNAYITLEGDLGVGKTTFVRYLLRAMGVKCRIKSPTYAVVETYQATNCINIWHFDFYRFHNGQEWEDAGFRDIFASSGLKLAEWPEKAKGFTPPVDLAIKIDLTADDTRCFTFSGIGSVGLALMKGISP